MALPLAVLGALALFPVLGVTLNMMSMVGLLIAVGRLVDSTIVINENIASVSAKAEGIGATDAAERGVKGVISAVFSSFLTSIAIFTPLAFLDGEIGRIMADIPVVLILVLTMALIASVYMLPHFTARSLSHQQKPGLIRRLRYQERLGI